MYRAYENPFEMEDRLAEAKARAAADPDNIDLACEVAELEEQVNFAWQDDEYDSDWED